MTAWKTRAWPFRNGRNKRCGNLQRCPMKETVRKNGICTGNRTVPGFLIAGIFENTRFRDMIMVQEHQTGN